jgi:hypothetical protein
MISSFVGAQVEGGGVRGSHWLRKTVCCLPADMVNFVSLLSCLWLESKMLKVNKNEN